MCEYHAMQNTIQIEPDNGVAVIFLVSGHYFEEADKLYLYRSEDIHSIKV